MKAIQITEFGGPEVLQYVDVPDPTPKEGEALIEVKAAGVNFADIYARRGGYGNRLPRIIGQEGAGVVRALGPGVTGLREGDVVAYSGAPGSYAELQAVPAARLIKMPDGLDAKDGAAAMLQGMTAHYLSHSAYPIKPGDLALVHAGAGGVGLLLTQLVKRLGGTVFSTVSSDEKAELSKQAGADHVIRYDRDDFAEEIKKITDGGPGVHVVYDGVGQTTFDKGLASLRPRGYMVLYGAASGPVPPVDPTRLNRGSLFLTRPTLFDYSEDRAELEQRAGDVLGWVRSGDLKLRVEHVYPLSEVRQAQEALESRQTTGKLLLVP